MVLQHAEGSENTLAGQILATVAGFKGHERARWLTAVRSVTGRRSRCALVVLSVGLILSVDILAQPGFLRTIGSMPSAIALGGVGLALWRSADRASEAS
jgi:hypothetical protein